MKSKRRILIVNANTSDAISALIRETAEDEAKGEASIEVATAPFGASYISSRATAAIAAHAVLEAAAQALAAPRPPDAIVVGCFGDPGLDALREVSPVPVVGFAEAGFRAASKEPGCYLVVTRGRVWCEMLDELASRLGIRNRITALESIGRSGDDVHDIARFVSERVAATKPDRVVLGGAGLIPIIPKVAKLLSIPVIDPHRAAINQAIACAGARSPMHEADDGKPVEFTGLSTGLIDLLVFRL
jgi:Asp/Glu/hydantoin racemase